MNCAPIVESNDDAISQGYDPSAGTLAEVVCQYQTSANGVGGVTFTYTTQWFPNGTTAPAPVVTEADVVNMATSQLHAPDVSIKIGPNPNSIAVKIPVFLYLSGGRPADVTAEAAVPGIDVVATASLKSVTWSTDEMIKDPSDQNQSAMSDNRCYVNGQTVPSDHGSYTTCTCPGPGVAPPTPYDGSNPPCGYMFIWRSTADRTHGRNTWTITAVANWQVTWTVNGATPGAEVPIDIRSPQATQAVQVHEYRTVLVSPNG